MVKYLLLLVSFAFAQLALPPCGVSGGAGGASTNSDTDFGEWGLYPAGCAYLVVSVFPPDLGCFPNPDGSLTLNPACATNDILKRFVDRVGGDSSWFRHYVHSALIVPNSGLVTKDTVAVKSFFDGVFLGIYTVIYPAIMFLCVCIIIALFVHVVKSS